MTSMPINRLIVESREASTGSGSRARTSISPWAWLAVTCLLLGASGGVRLWREWGFSSLAERSAACPFPMADIPRSMGTWQDIDDKEIQLDPQIARIAGASSHITRNYMDPKTGERAVVLALYGPCGDAFGHIPENCYPAAGYKPFKGPIDGEIRIPGLKQPVRYRWAIYAKREGDISRLEEVYHTFLYNGDWLPDVADRWKMFRYHPSLFKIQVAHPITGGLPEPGEGPIPELLSRFVREIQDRLAKSAPEPVTPLTAEAPPAS